MKSIAERPRALRLIILYKFVKTPIMLVLALWLTVAPNGAFRYLDSIASDLVEAGTTLAKLGAWIHAHLTSSILTRAALLAWLETVVTAVEAVLLLTGSAWAEWIVLVGLASPLPFELVSVDRRPSFTKAVVLAINVAIVFYLARRRIRELRTHHRQA